ncbi:hypothetical protein DCCM_1063 [Desulfocucumis palustris]|uniref:Uncharacterized protein n=1 Tax=Desulfocucumis palustris TaxID=1898651 RepID=A0A2L2X9D9_9FIRM|nr:hypothetical protein DCCM_1063 [Desulfocucumis palustris]
MQEWMAILPNFTNEQICLEKDSSEIYRNYKKILLWFDT